MKKKQPVSNMKRETSNADSLDRSEGGGDVHRSHGFMSVQSNVFDDFTIRIHVLPNGAYNTIVLRNKYKAPEMIKEYRGGQLSAVWRPMGCTAKVLSTKTVIFNGNVDKVFGAFRMAFQKAREWIELSKKEGKTPSDSLDMNIEVPDGCALEIPNDDDAAFVLNKLQNSKNLKKMKSGFKFWFSDKDRVLLFQCGDETFDFRWSAEQDKRTLTCAESACDEKLLLQLYAGRPGEADLFDVGQRYSKMPSVRNSQAIPKWASGVGDRATLKFPNGMMVGMARCSDGSVNYFFSPYMVGPFLTTVLIFPDDSRDDAYHAIEEAFRIALAWKSIAQKHHILNIVKEMKVPCPKSAAVEITGTKGAVELLWKSVSNADLSVMPTKFWFTVETQQTLKDGKWGYEQENTKYYLHFGNDDSQKYLELNDSTIASVGSLNPQLALRAMDAAVQNKAKEKSIFK